MKTEDLQTIAKTLQVKMDLDMPLPFYAKKGDAGLDLASAEDVILRPKQRILVSTGLHIALPKNSVGLIWDRSGLASNKGLHVLAGCIDEGYRGEVKVLLLNTSDKIVVLDKYARIAQLLVIPVLRPTVIEVSNFEETERGETGFGSSGE